MRAELLTLALQAVRDRIAPDLDGLKPWPKLYITPLDKRANQKLLDQLKGLQNEHKTVTDRCGPLGLVFGFAREHVLQLSRACLNISQAAKVQADAARCRQQ